MSPTRQLAVSLVTLAAGCTDDPVGPQLDLRTPLVAFGTVRCGTTATRTITVGNPGDEPLELRATSTIASVTLAPTFATVEPESALELTVTARATAIGPDRIVTDGDVNLSSNTPDGPRRVPVTFDTAGVSVSISPTDVDFGPVRSGETGFNPVLVSATGVGSAAFVVGPISGPGFELGSATRFELAAGRSAQLSLRFHPTGAPGPAAGALQLEATGELCSPKAAAITLHGTVLAP